VGEVGKRGIVAQRRGGPHTRSKNAKKAENRLRVLEEGLIEAKHQGGVRERGKKKIITELKIGSEKGKRKGPPRGKRFEPQKTNKAAKFFGKKVWRDKERRRSVDGIRERKTV